MARRPRIIIGLRNQDIVPDWISHVALVEGSTVITGAKDDVLRNSPTAVAERADLVQRTRESGRVLVDLKDVSIKYPGLESKPRVVSSLHVCARKSYTNLDSIGPQRYQLDSPRW